MGRIATVAYAALMCGLGLWMILSGSSLVWLTAALGLFLCGFGVQLLAVGLWRGAGESDILAVRLLRLTFALNLASGLAAEIAAFAYLELAAAIIASAFVLFWIWVQGWALVQIRKSERPAA